MNYYTWASLLVNEILFNIRLSFQETYGHRQTHIETQDQADRGISRKERKRQEHNICSLLVERAEICKNIKPGASYWLSCLKHKSCLCSILGSNPSLIYCAMYCISCAFLVSLNFTLSNKCKEYLKQTENTQRSRNLTNLTTISCSAHLTQLEGVDTGDFEAINAAAFLLSTESSKTIFIAVKDDDLPEADETFTFNLTLQVNAYCLSASLCVCVCACPLFLCSF